MEVLVCAAIIVTIAGVSLYSYSGFREKQAFTNADNDLVALIKQAQSKTLAGDTQLQYGVHLTSSAAVLLRRELRRYRHCHVRSIGEALGDQPLVRNA